MDMGNLVLVGVTVLVSIGAIPFLTNLIKKVSGTRAAPIVALVLGIVYAVVANLVGDTSVDLNTIVPIIMNGLGVGAGGIATFNVVKKTINNE